MTLDKKDKALVRLYMAACFHRWNLLPGEARSVSSSVVTHSRIQGSPDNALHLPSKCNSPLKEVFKAFRLLLASFTQSKADSVPFTSREKEHLIVNK